MKNGNTNAVPRLIAAALLIMNPLASEPSNL